jgi:hypothetical protein
MTKLKLIILFLFTVSRSNADEGLWLPFMLQQLNSNELYIHGLKIPVEEIYSINKSSLKDAVVNFGGGCTGELISYDGLLLTNHHCGYSSIQSHSSIEHNYLKDGFWASGRSDELPCPGLTATFIVNMEDVTGKIADQLPSGLSEADEAAKRADIISKIEKKAVEGTNYKAQIKAFFEGNIYILITSEVFSDVRMVGAPPSSIGNFGEETDNWMWPRHTGDFSLFRIYADKNNKPAAYNSANQPYHPRYAFTISLAGVKEGDFTMVYGFPGRTQEYLTSFGVDITVNLSNPNRISIRDKKIDVMNKYMKEDEKVFIQYASKLRSLANAYKKWKGEDKGIQQVSGIELKRNDEKEFNLWADENTQRKSIYGNLLKDFQNIYNDYGKYLTASDYYAEAASGSELINFSRNFEMLIDKAKSNNDSAVIADALKLQEGTKSFFKNYCMPLDREVTAVLLEDYSLKVDHTLLPDVFEKIENKYKLDYTAYVEKIFSKSMFSSEKKMISILQNFNASKAKQLENDPVYKLGKVMADAYNSKVLPVVSRKRAQLSRLTKLYIQGLQQMKKDKKLYPDANSTLRLAYGNVAGYFPADGVKYNYYTTLDGVMEKRNSGKEEYIVPEKLVQLYEAKDYGRYGMNGTMPVAFLATNHTTGGNSGSPVLNDKGELIGTNFDRVWEGTMSDILFSAERCRNISVDIRYTLFIIDKFAGAGYLLNEMTIVN